MDEVRGSRRKLPESLDALRARLDAAAVRRTFLHLDGPATTPDMLATALALPLSAIVVALKLEAGGDLLIAIIPANARLDLRSLAAAVGANRVRVAGQRGLRGADEKPALQPLVTDLPTVLDKSLANREYLFGASDDPGWALRIGAAALRRTTGAILADIVRAQRALRPESTGEV